MAAQITRIQDRQDTTKKTTAKTTKSGRTLSDHAAAAKLIRQELKKAWPSIRFSVTSESFAGGDAVSITWKDGPTTKEVEKITGKYQYGSFDSSIDYYETTNRRQDIPQTKYVQTQRGISHDVRDAAAAIIASRGGNLSPLDVQTMTNRMTYGQSFVCNQCQHPAHLGDRYCEACGHEITHNDDY